MYETDSMKFISG